MLSADRDRSRKRLAAEQGAANQFLTGAAQADEPDEFALEHIEGNRSDALAGELPDADDRFARCARRLDEELIGLAASCVLADPPPEIVAVPKESGSKPRNMAPVVMEPPDCTLSVPTPCSPTLIKSD